MEVFLLLKYKHALLPIWEPAYFVLLKIPVLSKYCIYNVSLKESIQWQLKWGCILQFSISPSRAVSCLKNTKLRAQPAACTMWPCGSHQEPLLCCHRGPNLKVSFQLSVFPDTSFSDTIVDSIGIAEWDGYNCFSGSVALQSLQNPPFQPKRESRVKFCPTLSIHNISLLWITPKGVQIAVLSQKWYACLTSQVPFWEDIWTCCGGIKWAGRCTHSNGNLFRLISLLWFFHLAL